MTAGFISSLCAGILIGLKIYYGYFMRKQKRRTEALIAESEAQRRMREIIEQQKYGVVYPEKGERIVKLEDGRYLLVTDDWNGRSFWHDLWYGTGQ